MLRIGSRVAVLNLTGTITDLLDQRGKTYYHVEYDAGLGWGTHEASELHLASEDYPEMGDILYDRPSPEKVLDGNPWKRTASHTASDSLDFDQTGDSYQSDTNDEQTHNDTSVSVNDSKCALCNLRKAEHDIGGAAVCSYCAQNRYGVDLGLDLTEQDNPLGDAEETGSSLDDPQTPPESPDDDEGGSSGKTATIDYFAKFNKEHEAGILDYLVNKVAPHLPDHGTAGWSFDSCRFRKNSHCWKSGQIDHNASAQMGYVVYVPKDMGPCPYVLWDQQTKCFSGDTEFLTYDGIRTLKEVVGTTQKVLTQTGQWVDAEIRSFGNQLLYEVNLVRGVAKKTIYATAEHRWFVKGLTGTERIERPSQYNERITYSRIEEISYVNVRHCLSGIDEASKLGVCSVCGLNTPLIKLTGKLNSRLVCEQARKESKSRSQSRGRKRVGQSKGLVAGDRLAWMFPNSFLYRWNQSPIGIMAGFVFGDGRSNNNDERLRGNDCTVTLFGEKDKQLLKYFAGHKTHTQTADGITRNVDGIQVSGLPRFFKDRPSLNESAEYLYGWLAGYFAADGKVKSQGTVYLNCADRQTLEFVQAVCNRLTIATGEITQENRKGCSGRGIVHDANIRRHGVCKLEERTPLYQIQLIGSTLTPDFFLIREHRNRFREAGQTDTGWTVESVMDTECVEEVYCAVVPETHSFVLAGNILTGNCGTSLSGPGYQPGPNAKGRVHFTDATVPFSQGGQRNGQGSPVTRLPTFASLMKAAELEEFYYHATHPRNRETIEREGIKPHDSEGVGNHTVWGFDSIGEAATWSDNKKMVVKYRPPSDAQKKHRTTINSGHVPPENIVSFHGPWAGPHKISSKHCDCCGGSGEHDTGLECYACDASGQSNDEPQPCDGKLGLGAGTLHAEGMAWNEHGLGGMSADSALFLNVVSPEGDPIHSETVEGGAGTHTRDALNRASNAAQTGHEASLQVEAAWKDVQAKARRLRSEGKVKITQLPTTTRPYLLGEVEGDHGVYVTQIVRLGKQSVKWWCDCTWGTYSQTGRNRKDRAAGSPYKTRRCSHLLATEYEMQSREMFGKEPKLGKLWGTKPDKSKSDNSSKDEALDYSQDKDTYKPKHNNEKTGDGFVHMPDGSRRWGLHGASGIMLRHTGDDGQHRYMLQRRSEHVQMGGTWSIPGGALHKDEDAFTGAKRELHEENGVSLPKGHKLIQQHEAKEPGWSYTTNVVHVPHQPKIGYGDGESTHYGWFTDKEMKTLPLHPGLKRAIPHILGEAKTGAKNGNQKEASGLESQSRLERSDSGSNGRVDGSSGSDNQGAQAGRRYSVEGSQEGQEGTNDVKTHPFAAKQYTKIKDHRISDLIDEHIDNLNTDHFPKASNAEHLSGRLKGYRSLRFNTVGGAYRVIYESHPKPDNSGHHITVHIIGAHDEAYKLATNRLAKKGYLEMFDWSEYQHYHTALLKQAEEESGEDEVRDDDDARDSDTDPHVGALFPNHHHTAKGYDEFFFEADLHSDPEPALPSTDGDSGSDDEDQTAGRETVGDPQPSEHWWNSHDTSADNPADMGPANFGQTLDPNYYETVMGTGGSGMGSGPGNNPDDSLLAPGPTMGSTGLGYENSNGWSGMVANLHSTAAVAPPKDLKPSWLAPAASEAGGDSTDIAQAARDYLSKKAGKTFTVAEQNEIIKEGEDDNRIASNYDRLDLTNTQYASLEAAFKEKEHELEDDGWLS
jgi:8-oxo-dGTP pyrophosphatase MutT (NUDIX family)